MPKIMSEGKAQLKSIQAAFLFYSQNSTLIRVIPKTFSGLISLITLNQPPNTK